MSQKVKRLRVSRPIYVAVDSPNQGFPYFNFLGGYQLKKNTLYVPKSKVAHSVTMSPTDLSTDSRLDSQKTCLISQNSLDFYDACTFVPKEARSLIHNTILQISITENQTLKNLSHFWCMHHADSICNKQTTTTMLVSIDSQV